jgi:hypothetical protein
MSLSFGDPKEERGGSVAKTLSHKFSCNGGKLRGCDVVRLKIGDLVSGGQVRTRAVFVQQKTGRLVQFELLSDAGGSLLAWLQRRGGTLGDFVFPSRVDYTTHAQVLLAMLARKPSLVRELLR